MSKKPKKVIDEDEKERVTELVNYGLLSFSVMVEYGRVYDDPLFWCAVIRSPQSNDKQKLEIAKIVKNDTVWINANNKINMSNLSEAESRFLSNKMIQIGLQRLKKSGDLVFKKIVKRRRDEKNC